MTFRCEACRWDDGPDRPRAELVVGGEVDEAQVVDRLPTSHRSTTVFWLSYLQLSRALEAVEDGNVAVHERVEVLALVKLKNFRRLKTST